MKKRVCYHQVHGEETYPLFIPIFDELRRVTGSEIRDFNLRGLLDWLDNLSDDVFPDAPPFELLKRFAQGRDETGRPKEVCVEAFSDLELGSLIDLEDSCHSYRCLPYEGGLFDQPNYIMEAFNIIRATKNKYNNAKMDEALKKSASQAPTNAQPKGYK